MPNYVYNKISTETKESFDELKERLLNTEGNVDFNKIIPQPCHLNEIEAYSNTKLKNQMIQYLRYQKVPFTETGITNFFQTLNPIQHMDDETRKNTSRHIQEGIKAIIDMKEEYPKEIPSKIELRNGKKVFLAFMTTGYFSWYQWNIKNWGVKWNAAHTVVNEKRYTINWDTAWDGVNHLIEQVVKDIKGVVDYRYVEEQVTEYGGEWIFENGVLISENNDPSEDDLEAIYADIVYG